MVHGDFIAKNVRIQEEAGPVLYAMDWEAAGWGAPVADLANEGYVTRRRSGRRNIYEVETGRAMRHRLARHREIGDFLQLMLEGLDLEQLEKVQR